RRGRRGSRRSSPSSAARPRSAGRPRRSRRPPGGTRSRYAWLPIRLARSLAYGYSARHGRHTGPRVIPGNAVQTRRTTPPWARASAAAAGAQGAHRLGLDAGELLQYGTGPVEEGRVAGLAGLGDQRGGLRPQLGGLGVPGVAGAQGGVVEPPGALGEEVAVEGAEQGAAGAAVLHEAGRLRQVLLRPVGTAQPAPH